MTAENFALQSTNFSVDKNGYIRATGGTVGGFTLGAKIFTSNLTLPYNYDSNDVERIRNIIIGTISPTYSDYEKYDLNQSGTIDTLDWMTIARIVNGSMSKESVYNINTDNSKKALEIIRDNTRVASIGAFGSYFHTLNCMNFNGASVTLTGNIDLRTSLNDIDINARSRIYIGHTSIDDIEGEGIFLYNQNENQTIHMFSGTGNITCVSLTQTSKAESKKNFEKLENALEIVQGTDIYKYNLKQQEDGGKKHIGFVIGDEFNYREEITSEKNDGVDTYSMVSVLWKAVQEQQEQIEELKKEIKELKGEK